MASSAYWPYCDLQHAHSGITAGTSSVVFLQEVWLFGHVSIKKKKWCLTNKGKKDYSNGLTVITNVEGHLHKLQQRIFLFKRWNWKEGDLPGCLNSSLRLIWIICSGVANLLRKPYWRQDMPLKTTVKGLSHHYIHSAIHQIPLYSTSLADRGDTSLHIKTKGLFTVLQGFYLGNVCQITQEVKDLKMMSQHQRRYAGWNSKNPGVYQEDSRQRWAAKSEVFKLFLSS